MLQEERKLSRELQADLRAKDEDLRSLLQRKEEDLLARNQRPRNVLSPPTTRQGQHGACL